MSQRVILHSDMNNFYASVECMLRPELQNQVVAVCGNQEERNGIVLAKNTKAKELGIQTGEVIWQAQQKCPHLIIVPPQYDQYMKYSALAKKIYIQYTPLVESFGMDECWLDVTGSQQGSGWDIAEKIRKTIQKELGLTVSIGISYNKIFAKLASDMKKPNAVTEIFAETFREQIWHLPVGELLGVGKATTKKLRTYNIQTIGQLAQVQEDYMYQWFGLNGRKLHRFANGLDHSPVTSYDYIAPVKTIGHGITAIEDLENPQEVWCLILALSQKIGTKLRHLHKKAGGISIAVKNCSLLTRQWQRKLDLQTQSPSVIAEACFTRFQEEYPWDEPVRAISIRGIYLEDASIPIQYDLFTDVTEAEKKEKIDNAIEKIRDKFGRKSIIHACLYQNEKIPDTEGIELTMPTAYF